MAKKCNNCGEAYQTSGGYVFCPACGYLHDKRRSAKEDKRLAVAYAQLRMGRFSAAEKLFTEFIQDRPRDAEGYWGMLLCRYGIVYESSDGEYVPVCYILRRNSIYTDHYFQEAYALASGTFCEYLWYEGMRVENARRLCAYRADRRALKKKGMISSYVSHQPLTGVTFERDLRKKRGSRVQAAVCIVLACLFFLIAGLGMAYLYLQWNPQSALDWLSCVQGRLVWPSAMLGAL